MHAIILAGGLGTRLRPLTYKIPKPMIPVKDKPLVEWCILNLKKHGIKDIVLSIGYLAEKVQDYFQDGSNLGLNIKYNIEKELLGTGGAVKDVVNKFSINEPFILVWADNLADYDFTKMKEIFNKNQADVVMALTTREDVEHFGVAELSHDKIVKFIEKPEREKAPSNLINGGGFIINPKALTTLPEGVSNIERECFEKLCGENGSVFAFKHNGYWLPTDTKEKYELAKKEFNSEL